MFFLHRSLSQIQSNSNYFEREGEKNDGEEKQHTQHKAMMRDGARAPDRYWLAALFPFFFFGVHMRQQHIIHHCDDDDDGWARE